MTEMVQDANMEAGVLAALDAIRPALQSDGGDIEFIGIDSEGILHVKLLGACGSCAISTLTLKAGMERIVMDRVPGIKSVVNDGDLVTNEAHS